MRAEDQQPTDGHCPVSSAHTHTNHSVQLSCYTSYMHSITIQRTALDYIRTTVTGRHTKQQLVMHYRDVVLDWELTFPSTILKNVVASALMSNIGTKQLSHEPSNTHNCIYIGWQWRNFFISAVFRHFVGQALLNVCCSDVSRRHFLNKIAIVRTFS